MNYLCDMTTELPANILDLVCCLEENCSDDEFIVSVILDVLSSQKKISKLIAFLQTGERSEESILHRLREL